jgi:glycosyltransferase involved in cell wall biosynthesis
MQTVLVLAFTDLASDPRVDRQLRFLKGRYHVVAAGLGPPAVEGVGFVRIAPPRKGALRKLWAALLLACRCYDSYYWHRALVEESCRRLAGVRADLVLANDLIALPLARRLARGGRVFFDAHEYAPREYEDHFFWRLFQGPFAAALCREHVPHVDAMTTVCEGLARAYAELTGVRPAVLTNAPFYHDLAPRPYREGARPIQLVHHGILYRSRKLENMILMMDHLDGRFELNLLLVGSDRRYRARLEALARARPAVRFLSPVSMRELPAYLNRFDMGVFLLEPVCFNYRYALPNKLFELIQARLGVAIGPSPEMARVVTEAGCGVVAPGFDPASLAACLNRLSEREINGFKERAHRAARAHCAEANEALFLGLVERALGRAAASGAA